MASKDIDWALYDDKVLKAYAEKVPVAEIARTLGMAASTINRRLFQLRAKTTSQKDSWLPIHVDILKAEWAKGTVASLIGPMIDKSRNAVIGKAHRMNLGGRAPSNGRPPKEKGLVVPRRAAKPKHEMTAFRGVKSSPPKFFAAAVPLGTKPPISIMELNATTCRAPVGRGADGLVTYCGDMTFPGQAWCPGHCAIFFVPPKERNRRYR